MRQQKLLHEGKYEMKILLIIALLFLSGCMSTAKNMNHVSIGMSKSEVISILGEPMETRGTNGIEYTIYNLRTAASAGAQAGCGVAGVYTLGLAYLAEGCQSKNADYFVSFKENKVSSYGRIGDFNSTQKPEATVNVNNTVRHVD